MIKKTSSKGAIKPVMPVSPPPKQSQKGGYVFIAVIVVVVLTAFALMAVNALKTKNNNQNQNQAAGQKTDVQKGDVASVIGRVSQLIMVKSSEQPTVATVQDANMLRQGNPLFYKDAENGDRLLVWSDKAVLYSVKMDKLLAVMPIAIGQDAQQATSTTPTVQSTSTAATVESEGATIEIRNGTMTAGLGKKLSTTLKNGKMNVKYVTDAQKKDYAETVIYKNTGKNLDATLAALAASVKAKVVEGLPKETGLKGDIVVVVGSDFK